MYNFLCLSEFTEPLTYFFRKLRVCVGLIMLAGHLGITWRPACALQTWVALTLDNFKKADKTIMTDQ